MEINYEPEKEVGDDEKSPKKVGDDDKSPKKEHGREDSTEQKST